MVEGGRFDVPRAVAAASATASELGLAVDEAEVIQASNRLTVRLLPADVLVRVASRAHGAAQLEVDLALRLARTDAPVAALDPRVQPRVYERDGFAITLWTYYAVDRSRELCPADYADALARLHAGLREVDLRTPSFTDRVKEAASLVSDRHRTPDLSDADRSLLARTFATTSRSIRERNARQQLLHGEPHPGNVLNTIDAPLFIDLETCCRGPIEFDLANVPSAVSDAYPGVDQALLGDCRLLTLAMIAAWRLDPEDQFPQGPQTLRQLLAAVRAGPPYPALGTITGLR